MKIQKKLDKKQVILENITELESEPSRYYFAFFTEDTLKSRCDDVFKFTKSKNTNISIKVELNTNQEEEEKYYFFQLKVIDSRVDLLCMI